MADTAAVRRSARVAAKRAAEPEPLKEVKKKPASKQKKQKIEPKKEEEQVKNGKVEKEEEEEEEVQGLEIGDEIPDITLEDQDGEKVNLKEVGNDKTILLFGECSKTITPLQLIKWF